MYESHHDSSVTKATITAGKITLNKDSQPVHTKVEALAKTLPISTALDNANPQVEKPKDTQGQLKEQKIVREAVSQLQSAASTYAANQAKAAQLEADRLQQELAQEQSKPQAMQDKQKIAEKTTALATTLERQEKWSEKGEYKRNLDNLTTITGGILAGQSGAQIATTLASPTLNEKIKELTTDSNGEVNVLTNTLAHAMLGAVEAAAAKGNITAGALAASASELAAPAITKALGKDNPNQLSAEERQIVTALSALAGSLASGLTAQQNGSATNTVSTLNAAALGGEIGKRAVENNFFDYSLQDIEAMAINAKASELKEEINEKVIENFEKEHPELVEHLRKTGDIASFLADLTPGIGDVKSFAEAEDGIDYLLATIGIIPGSDIVTKPLKGAKQAFKKAKEAEKLGHSKDIIKYQKEATRYINNSVNGFYDSKEYRELLTRKYGGNVKSTTVPPSNAKNVNLAGK
ncbi:Possible hemagglutinin (DUF638) [uncultured Avibacterium sp.]|uniref:Possible hemagglutinin (DUF638) n=1 Tax=uncultured Avibacterium sp. TaxID=1936169 RepID=A0A486XCX2_9PAST|nr:Possible hemagglutinin (DUF638) [uncultured Avibacterium sp.]